MTLEAQLKPNIQKKDNSEKLNRGKRVRGVCLCVSEDAINVHIHGVIICFGIA